MDADIFPLRRPDLSDKLDGAIGEFSPFHEMYGYYAHGIAPESFKAPEGWEQRLIQVEVERVGRNRPAVGWCLEPHDLVASKCAARRERDWEYAKVCVERGLVDREVLWERAQTLPIPADVLAYVLSVLGGILGRR
jgi:hypothetical protein